MHDGVVSPSTSIVMFSAAMVRLCDTRNALSRVRIYVSASIKPTATTTCCGQFLRPSVACAYSDHVVELSE